MKGSWTFASIPDRWQAAGHLQRFLPDSSRLKFKSVDGVIRLKNNKGLVNRDPDVDAIFRLTRKGRSASFNITFDPVTPSVLLPFGTFSPFNSQNTLFLHKAFWALLLPTTTTFRVSDIWRSYWAQRLLWEIDGRLGFVRANARQRRNAHNYLDDARDELPMFFHTDQLLNFLTDWSCPQHLSFFSCVELLSFDMAKAEFWGMEDARNTRLWLQDLLDVGYPEPTRINFNLTSCSLASSQTHFLSVACSQSPKSCNGHEAKLDFVRFHPTEMKSPSLSALPSQDHLFSRGLLQIVKVCPNFNLSLKNLAETYQVNSFFRNILAIIVFHYPQYTNIPFTEAAYRLTFTNIAYCGPDASALRNLTLDITYNVTFIEAELDRGRVGYTCLLKAIAIGFRVKGYLILGDDVLLNPWTLSKLNKSRIWTTSESIVVVDKSRAQTSARWQWWKSSFGGHALEKALSELAGLAVPIGVTPPERHRFRLEKNSGGRNKTLRCLVDTYYVPAMLASSVTWYLTSFLRHRVFSELAVPFVLYGLQRREEIEDIRGKSVWKRDRDDPWKFYNPHAQYLHPIKFSSKQNQEKLCQNFVPELMKHVLGLGLIDQDIRYVTET
ncbi:conserved uncharacterized protein [Plakobranchus ocellatus]|uniref:Conserved uncharacterized protein n=1 Tax=Plakobranchus ocellatus TaxID=259542 RepID=A0AAV4AD97_9GAST|nr:conserved uncharacterized protein [Plakobranchus ocellatus]